MWVIDKKSEREELAMNEELEQPEEITIESCGYYFVINTTTEGRESFDYYSPENEIVENLTIVAKKTIGDLNIFILQGENGQRYELQQHPSERLLDIELAGGLDQESMLPGASAEVEKVVFIDGKDTYFPAFCRTIPNNTHSLDEEVKTVLGEKNALAFLENLPVAAQWELAAGDAVSLGYAQLDNFEVEEDEAGAIQHITFSGMHKVGLLGLERGSQPVSALVARSPEMMFKKQLLLFERPEPPEPPLWLSALGQYDNDGPITEEQLEGIKNHYTKQCQTAEQAIEKVIREGLKSAVDVDEDYIQPLKEKLIAPVETLETEDIEFLKHYIEPDRLRRHPQRERLTQLINDKLALYAYKVQRQTFESAYQTHEGEGEELLAAKNKKTLQKALVLLKKLPKTEAISAQIEEELKQAEPRGLHEFIDKFFLFNAVAADNVWSGNDINRGGIAENYTDIRALTALYSQSLDDNGLAIDEEVPKQAARDLLTHLPEQFILSPGDAKVNMCSAGAWWCFQQAEKSPHFKSQLKFFHVLDNISAFKRAYDYIGQLPEENAVQQTALSILYQKTQEVGVLPEKEIADFIRNFNGFFERYLNNNLGNASLLLSIVLNNLHLLNDIELIEALYETIEALDGDDIKTHAHYIFTDISVKISGGGDTKKITPYIKELTKWLKKYNEDKIKSPEAIEALMAFFELTPAEKIIAESPGDVAASSSVAQRYEHYKSPLLSGAEAADEDTNHQQLGISILKGVIQKAADNITEVQCVAWAFVVLDNLPTSSASATLLYKALQENNKKEPGERRALHEIMDKTFIFDIYQAGHKTQADILTQLFYKSQALDGWTNMGEKQLEANLVGEKFVDLAGYEANLVSDYQVRLQDGDSPLTARAIAREICENLPREQLMDGKLVKWLASRAGAKWCEERPANAPIKYHLNNSILLNSNKALQKLKSMVEHKNDPLQSSGKALVLHFAEELRAKDKSTRKAAQEKLEKINKRLLRHGDTIIFSRKDFEALLPVFELKGVDAFDEEQHNFSPLKDKDVFLPQVQALEAPTALQQFGTSLINMLAERSSEALQSEEHLYAWAKKILTKFPQQSPSYSAMIKKLDEAEEGVPLCDVLKQTFLLDMLFANEEKADCHDFIQQLRELRERSLALAEKDADDEKAAELPLVAATKAQALNGTLFELYEDILNMDGGGTVAQCAQQTLEAFLGNEDLDLERDFDALSFRFIVSRLEPRACQALAENDNTFAYLLKRTAVMGRHRGLHVFSQEIAMLPDEDDTIKAASHRLLHRLADDMAQGNKVNRQISAATKFLRKYKKQGYLEAKNVDELSRALDLSKRAELQGLQVRDDEPVGGGLFPPNEQYEADEGGDNHQQEAINWMQTFHDEERRRAEANIRENYPSPRDDPSKFGEFSRAFLGDVDAQPAIDGGFVDSLKNYKEMLQRKIHADLVALDLAIESMQDVNRLPAAVYVAKLTELHRQHDVLVGDIFDRAKQDYVDADNAPITDADNERLVATHVAPMREQLEELYGTLETQLRKKLNIMKRIDAYHQLTETRTTQFSRERPAVSASFEKFAPIYAEEMHKLNQPLQLNSRFKGKGTIHVHSNGHINMPGNMEFSEFRSWLRGYTKCFGFKRNVKNNFAQVLVAAGYETFDLSKIKMTGYSSQEYAALIEAAKEGISAHNERSPQSAITLRDNPAPLNPRLGG